MEPRPLILPEDFAARDGPCSRGLPPSKHREYGERRHRHVVIGACERDCWCFFTRSGGRGDDHMEREDAILVRDLRWAVEAVETAEDLRAQLAACERDLAEARERAEDAKVCEFQADHDCKQAQEETRKAFADLAQRDRELHEAWAREAVLRDTLADALDTLLGWGRHDTRCEFGYQAGCPLDDSIRRAQDALQASDAAPLEAIHGVIAAWNDPYREESDWLRDAIADLIRFFGEPRP